MLVHCAEHSISPKRNLLDHVGTLDEIQVIVVHYCGQRGKHTGRTGPIGAICVQNGALRIEQIQGNTVDSSNNFNVVTGHTPMKK